MCTAPANQLNKVAMAAVVLEGLAIVGSAVALDDELRFPARMVTAEDQISSGWPQVLVHKLTTAAANRAGLDVNMLDVRVLDANAFI